MEMHDPVHPDEIVREECLKPSRPCRDRSGRGRWRHAQALSGLLNGHTGVSPDMAIPLGKGFRKHGLPGDLEPQIEALVADYNHRRYLAERERIKRQTIANSNESFCPVATAPVSTIPITREPSTLAADRKSESAPGLV
jgi:hypothetical protein